MLISHRTGTFELATSQPKTEILFGIGVSPGVAIGEAFVVDRRKVRYPTHHIEPEDTGSEIQRFKQAVNGAKDSLNLLRDKLIAQGEREHTAILDAHLLMMQDPLLLEDTERRISDERKCAEWAFRSTLREIKRHFDALGDDYFRERRSDIDFVGQRILAALSNENERPIDQAPENAILVAHELSPADTLSLAKRHVKGIVTEVGGATSHTAILACALEIPAVLGCAEVVDQVGRGDRMVVNGEKGEVLLQPNAQVVMHYQELAEEQLNFRSQLRKESALAPETTDQHAVEILANIELVDEAKGVVANGATGVGLYRTEFLFLREGPLPTEEEHFRTYAQVLAELGPDAKVVFRTFDLGSDKLSDKLKLPAEHNPALGLRGCRLALAHEPLLRDQLRALLRATGACQAGSIMFPMISDVAELRMMRAVLNEEMDALEKEGHAIWRDVPVGIMVELPSAVWVADRLAQECDFFSVGTNDLLQYSLAMDRGNEHVAHLYHPLHLSNLRALEHVVKAGHAAGIPVGLCGEMAAVPLNLPISVALGFDSLSMPLSAVPEIKWYLRRFAKADADALLADCMHLSLAEDIELRVRQAITQWVPQRGRLSIVPH